MGTTQGRKGWIAGALVGIFAFAGVAYSTGVFDGIFRKTPSETARHAGVVETADAVKIPLASLESGRALFLVREESGRQLHYFALKSADGRYRAAFDACDVCFRANRGYRQEGDLMVCNQCGQSFPSVKVNEVKGGCNPAPLARTVEGGFLVIRKGDIAGGKEYFAGKRT